jgi:hypothetical protein
VSARHATGTGDRGGGNEEQQASAQAFEIRQSVSQQRFYDRSALGVLTIFSSLSLIVVHLCLCAHLFSSVEDRPHSFPRWAVRGSGGRKGGASAGITSSSAWENLTCFGTAPKHTRIASRRTWLLSHGRGVVYSRV